MRSTATRRGRAASIATLLAVAAITACTGGTEFAQTTFHPVSEYGAALNRLFINTFVWTMGILVLVVVLLFYVLIRFRERPGQPHPKQIHGNTMLEMAWTFVPAVIVMFIAVPAIQGVFATQRRAAEDALEVEVIGHQWWWEFRYPAEGVVTANQLVLPVGREIHLRIRSADVVHSFWVPRIGGKRDAMPQPRTAEGERPRPNHMIFTVDEPGQYRGQCAEFCGEAHAIMATHALAVTPQEFEAWIPTMKDTPALPPGDAAAGAAAPAQETQAAATPAAPETLEEQGRRVFLSKSCIACHAVANTNAIGQVGPNLTRFGARPTVGAGARANTVDNVAEWIRDPQSMKAGVLMPGAQAAAGGFPPTGLTDEEVRAVAAWLVSLR